MLKPFKLKQTDKNKELVEQIRQEVISELIKDGKLKI